jgi:predicted HTH transcriptional regulator
LEIANTLIAMNIDLEKFDLTQLPSAEDDDFEFKSSRTSINDLRDKLAHAVSGFANFGGGCFVAGVDDSGIPDNGFPRYISGRQDIRDWADQIMVVRQINVGKLRISNHDQVWLVNPAR